MNPQEYIKELVEKLIIEVYAKKIGCRVLLGKQSMLSLIQSM